MAGLEKSARSAADFVLVSDPKKNDFYHPESSAHKPEMYVFFILRIIRTNIHIFS